MTDPEQSADSPLAPLLQAEQTIARQLEDERTRIRRWLEAETAEIERLIEQEVERLDRSREAFLAEAKREAEEKAEATVAAAAAWAERLAAIDLQSLEPLIHRHLAPIDPRRRDDRPDVEN